MDNEYEYHKRIYASNVVAHYNPHYTAWELQGRVFKDDPDAIITGIDIVPVEKPEAFDVTVRYIQSEAAAKRLREIMSKATPAMFRIAVDGDGSPGQGEDA